MGTFYVGRRVENHKNPKRAAVVPKLIVDTGSEFAQVPSATLEKTGVEPQKKDIQIQMAKGQILTCTIGFVVLRVDRFFTINEVVSAQPGDLPLLGSRALERMNVCVDTRKKRLVAAGPVVAAGTVLPARECGGI